MRDRETGRTWVTQNVIFGNVAAADYHEFEMPADACLVRLEGLLSNGGSGGAVTCKPRLIDATGPVLAEIETADAAPLWSGQWACVSGGTVRVYLAPDVDTVDGSGFVRVSWCSGLMP